MLPSGTVTFLFTDIEGSTRLWEDHHEGMRHALERHNDLLQRAIDSAGGVTFKTVGDGFCAVFSSAPDGLCAAVEAQRALAAEPWSPEFEIRVRMALHTGACVEQNGDFFGPAGNRVARLMATAHGGQVVLSGTTAELVRHSLPPGVWMTDLGEHRLKDLSQPEHVFQLNAIGLVNEFPPIRSLDAFRTKNNLPVQMTTFVGREEELAQLTVLMGGSRLVSLTGTGGCGKTRLALQLAGEMVAAFADGVWFVELAPLRDPHLVADALAAAVGVRQQPGRPLLETLTSVLSDWRALIVLDNCEHLLDGCAEAVDTLVRGCPGLSVLATSREPLQVPGEHIYRVPPLPCPVAETPTSTTEASRYSAIRLLSERAVAHRHGFDLEDADVPVAASICSRLDGLPLAIELAAARLSSLSLREIENRLDDRFRLLTGGARTSVPRQQTLSALIEWSYDLLTHEEKSVLCRLSVFAGGWTLEAAERVGAPDEHLSYQMVDILGSLVDKNLVQAQIVGETMRYRLLETIREFSALKLRREFGAQETPVRSAHARFFLDLAEAAARHLAGADQSPWFDRLDVEHDNLRAACGFLLSDRGSLEDALRMGVALRDFWYCGYLREGAELLDAALDRLDPDAGGLRASAGIGAAYLHFEQGDYRGAQARFEDVARSASADGDLVNASQAQGGLGLLALRQGVLDRALERCEQSVTLAMECRDPYVMAEAFNHRAAVRSAYGDMRAEDDARTALYQFRIADNLIGVARVLQNLTVLELKRLDLAAARRHISECLELRRTIKGMGELHATLFDRGLLELLEGDAGAARSDFEESLSISCRIGARPSIAFALLGLSFCAGMDDATGRAATLHGAADQLFDTLGETLDADLDAYRRREQRRLRNRMGAAAFDDAYRAGQAMTQHEAVAFAET